MNMSSGCQEEEVRLVHAAYVKQKSAASSIRLADDRCAEN